MYWIIIVLIVIAEIVFACVFPNSWNFIFWLIGITIFGKILWSLSIWIADTIHNYFDNKKK